MLEDKAGNLWFGGLTKGVSRYDGKRFTQFTTKEGLSSNYVHSMVEDNTATFGSVLLDGVTRYDGKTFRHFSEKEGLSTIQFTYAER
jgi:ligand-binding sensor domain-containing protein